MMGNAVTKSCAPECEATALYLSGWRRAMSIEPLAPMEWPATHLFQGAVDTQKASSMKSTRS